MPKLRLRDTVRVAETGEVTTLAALLDTGRAVVTKVEHFYAPRSPKGYRTAYFVDMVGTTSGWEVGETAYKSRVERGYAAPKVNPKATPTAQDETPETFRSVLQRLGSTLLDTRRAVYPASHILRELSVVRPTFLDVHAVVDSENGLVVVGTMNKVTYRIVEAHSA